MAYLTVAGFGDADMNGIYTAEGTVNGQTLYRNGDKGYISYTTANSVVSVPFYNVTGWYMVKTQQLLRSNMIERPEYRVAGSDPEATEWISFLSGEHNMCKIGTVTLTSESLPS